MKIDGPVTLNQHERGIGEPSRPESPDAMFKRAYDEYLEPGRCGIQQLLDTAAAHRDKWGRLAEQIEHGVDLDGRASIYTGETYAEARDRWEAYRQLLVEHARGVIGDLA